MSLLTPDDIRQHIDTDLGNEALQRLIDDAEDDIVRAYGPTTGTVTERFTPGPGDAWIFTSRPISAITSITELRSTYAGETDVTLGSADYVLEGTRQIRRKQGGTNSASSWGPLTTIVYTPADDTDRRKRVLIDLVRLALRYDATRSGSVGDTSVTHLEYEAERTRLLTRLGTMSGGFA